MLFRLGLMVSLLIPFMSFAEIDPLVNQGETVATTHYDTLAEWFRNGEVITLDDVPRSRPGRCFEIWNPNTPIHGLLFKVQRSQDGDLGPGLEGQLDVAIASLFRRDESGRALPPNALDNLPPSELTEAERAIWRELRDGRLKLAEDSETSVTWIVDFEPNGRLDLRHTLVRSSDYLVLEVYNLISNNIMSSLSEGLSRRGIAVGPVTYCYFFNPTASN